MISQNLLSFDKCNGSWGTIKLIIGWIMDTVSMTTHLPPCHLACPAETLASIPTTQKRTIIKKWRKVLGELRSISLALSGTQNMFSQMQHALANRLNVRVALNKGVHHALDDFKWITRSFKT